MVQKFSKFKLDFSLLIYGQESLLALN